MQINNKTKLMWAENLFWLLCSPGCRNRTFSINFILNNKSFLLDRFLVNPGQIRPLELLLLSCGLDHTYFTQIHVCIISTQVCIHDHGPPRSESFCRIYFQYCPQGGLEELYILGLCRLPSNTLVTLLDVGNM